jgi:CBS domain-containing protein
MSKPIVYCRTDEDVEDALHIMEANRVRRLPVINDKKRLVGMLSLGDLSNRVPREMAGEVICSVAAHHS